MDQIKQRLAIAEYQGWIVKKGVMNYDGAEMPWTVLEKGGKTIGLSMFPNPIVDLNAMHEVEHNYWFKDMKQFYTDANLYNSYQRYCALLGYDIHATATRRAEVFLRMIGKWEE